MAQTPATAPSAFSSQDVVLSAALKRLPDVLKEATKKAGLDDPSLLQSYPQALDVSSIDAAVLGTSTLGDPV